MRGPSLIAPYLTVLLVYKVLYAVDQMNAPDHFHPSMYQTRYLYLQASTIFFGPLMA